MELRKYQEALARKATDIIWEYGLCYFAMECRVGKTAIALRTAELYGAGSVLFLTKKKAMASVLHDYDALGLKGKFELTVMNHESAHKCEGDFDLVVLDEAHAYGTYPKPNKKTRSARELCHGKPVIFMSGTPTPESYSQIYHQLWCSDRSPFAEHKTFYHWARAGYVEAREMKINGMPHRDYSRASKEMVDEATRHIFLTYTQAQAGIEVGINEEVRTVRMSELTERFFNEMDRKKVIIHGKHTVLGDTPAKWADKLHQISSGTVITESGDRLIIDNSKCEYIKKHFAGKKIAIFCLYTAEKYMIEQAFPNHTDSPEEFQESSDKVFVCQVVRGREGVRLDTADYLIYFNVGFSYLSYEQGRNRAISKEREKPANVVFLVSHCGIEQMVLDRVRDKQDFTTAYYVKARKRRTAGAR